MLRINSPLQLTAVRYQSLKTHLMPRCSNKDDIDYH
jgi:hypothetical protein